MAEPTKAYRVVERWTAHKTFVVFAHSVEEAKEHVRKGTGDREGVDDHFTNAGISDARRWPAEDRDVEPEPQGG